MDSPSRVAADLAALYPRLIQGDMGVIAAFALKATVDSPLGAKQELPEFVAETHAWLERHDARTEQVHTVDTPGRVIHELVLRMSFDGVERELPVMLVADVAEDSIRDLRVYHSTWPLTGSHVVRRPLMNYTLADRPAEPVGSYHEALSEGDAEKADACFEPDGCVREPAGGQWEACGSKRSEWYRTILSKGPIILHLGTITDDGETVVYEYLADRWGSETIPAQAGAAAYQRGASGQARLGKDLRRH